MIFVDTVITQMHKLVAHLLPVKAELLRTEADNSLTEDEKLQRIHTRYQKVESHIKLFTTDQERPCDVFLDNNSILDNIIWKTTS